MAESNVKFVDGMFAKRSEKAPEFVIVNLSVKAEEFIKFLKNNVNEKGYVNITIRESANGKMYAALDTYEPKQKQVEEQPTNWDNSPF